MANKKNKKSNSKAKCESAACQVRTETGATTRSTELDTIRELQNQSACPILSGGVDESKVSTFTPSPELHSPPMVSSNVGSQVRENGEKTSDEVPDISPGAHSSQNINITEIETPPESEAPDGQMVQNEPEAAPNPYSRAALQPLSSGYERDRQDAKFNHYSEEEKRKLKAGYKKLCSDATLQATSDGFFKTFDRQVIETVTDAQFDEFGTLKTDEERVFFVWQLPAVHSTISVKPFSRDKSSSIAEEEKQLGNRCFQQKKYRQAVAHYSRMVVRAPAHDEPAGGDLLSVGYANRSAALLHMEKYDLCLKDIEHALKSDYPRRLLYKLLDRRATCQLKLGEVASARATLQELRQSLDDADLDENKRAAWQRDVQQKVDAGDKQLDFKPIMTHEEEPIPALPSQNAHFVSASSAVDVSYSPEGGRYAVATQNVRPGDVLVVERPHAAVLCQSKLATHCLHCMTRVLVAFPCRLCSGVMFCSPECRDAAQPYHQWECGILDVLHASGMSVLVQLALRLVTTHSAEFFKELRPELQKQRDPSARPTTDASSSTYDPSSYLSVHQLVTLAELREPADFFHRALMSCLLLKYLRVAGYFGGTPGQDASDQPLTEDELLVGGLLLRHLQLLQFNAHEVGEYLMMEPGQYKQSRSVNIGVAVYPTVSFFNHSCEGGVSRSFVGNTLVIRSVTSVAPGEPIFENYGPVFSHRSREDRQHWLRSRYWFDCACRACSEDWADFELLDHTKVQLMCQQCGAGIWNQVSGKNANGDCAKCGKKNNIVQLFRDYTTITEHYNSAVKIMDEGDPMRALRLMYRYIEQVPALVVKPNRDLAICQEAARMCLASLGSCHSIKGGQR